jgi:hypothetical protein
VSLLSSPSLERNLAIKRIRRLMWDAWIRGDDSDARWHEKCLSDLEKMSDEEFAERYKDVDE